MKQDQIAAEDDKAGHQGSSRSTAIETGEDISEQSITAAIKQDGLPGFSAKPALTKRPPPSFADKIRRGFWSLAWSLLFYPSPVPLHAWRRFLLRRFGARIGRRVAVYPSCRIWAPWNVEIADGATIGSGAILYSVDRIVIGEAAIVSQGAHLCTATHDHNSPDFDLMCAPIIIADEAWVAAEAFVGPGVTVGRGAVVAARAVAVRPVDPQCVVAGNPAKPVSRRSIHGRNRLRGRVKASES
jgi:putative colanic acid biosynthesis acetyltransferase WcaF